MILQLFKYFYSAVKPGKPMQKKKERKKETESPLLK
jgi:hypothetical protein